MILADATVSTQPLSVATNVLVGLAVLALICVRQLRRRPVADAGWRVPVVLAVVGGYETLRALDAAEPSHRVPVLALVVLVGGLVVGAGLAAVRGWQMRVWRDDDGVVVRQGTALTIVLWLVAVGLHLGADALLAHVEPSVSGVGSASILLYLGVVLALQQLVVQRRAGLLPAAVA